MIALQILQQGLFQRNKMCRKMRRRLLLKKDDLKQKDVDQLLTFDPSKPPQQPAEASEEAETLKETESIAAGGK